MGDTFVKCLIVAYVVIATVYGIEGDWGRVLYFVGATILSFGVLMMK